MRFLVPVLTLTLALTGCAGGRERLPSPSEVFGPSTATGTILGTGASLYRRGTHVLLVEGHPRFFLESKQVDLRAYEGKGAVVRGEIVPNTHPSFLPVIEVTEVVLRGSESSMELQAYDVPSLGLALDAPRAWKSTLAANRLVFAVQEGERPFFMLERASAVPEGLPLRIGGRNGVRLVDEVTGEHRVYVRREDDVLLFSFDPRAADDTASRDAFYTLLQTVRFRDAGSSSSSSSVPQDEGGPFIPCGGPAHVLCPAGMFCEVREADTGIGRCRRLGE